MRETPEPAGDVYIVGWREYVDLPAWGLSRIRAKADTGARSSALDVANLTELPGERVRFDVIVDRSAEHPAHTIEAAITRRTRVRSSFGAAHDRLFIITQIAIAGRTVETEVGLVCRKNMLCRMLLGRKTLERGFLVDPGRRYLHRASRSKKKRKRTARKD